MSLCCGVNDRENVPSKPALIFLIYMVYFIHILDGPTHIHILGGPTKHELCPKVTSLINIYIIF